MISVRGFHQLCRDAQTVVSSAHAPLKNRAHFQLLADDARVDVFALEGEGRAARDDVEVRDLGESVDDFFGNTVGEILVLRVAAHIHERHYDDRIADRALGGGGRGAVCGYRCDQSIASFRDCLDNAWFAGIVLKGAAQLGNAALQYILGHGDVGPYGLKQLLLGKRFAGVLGQAHQDSHYLWLEANGPAFTRHAVEGRIDDPAPHFEALLHELPRAGYRAGKYTAYEGRPHENCLSIY